jgi:hypothetical protein
MVLEEPMRDLWLGILLVPVLALGVPRVCNAEEFAGRLVRVDKTTVTLKGQGDATVVVQVDNGHRADAAPYLGRWVTVDVRTECGGTRAVRFKAHP